MKKSYTSFSTGEISDSARHRQELSQLARGCRTLRNGELTRYGEIDKRGGSWFKGLGKQTENIRLFSFGFSTTTKFMLELGPLYVRFWSNGLQVIDGDNPLEVVTPYTSGQLHELQFQPVRDFIYIAHKDQAPKILKRYADDDWRLEDFEGVPFYDAEGDLTPSADTGVVNLVASEGVFEGEHVGAKVRIGYRSDPETVLFSLYNAYTSAPQVVGPSYTADRLTYPVTNQVASLVNLAAVSYTEGQAIHTDEPFDRFYTCIQDFDHTSDYVPGDDHPDDYPAFFRSGAFMFQPVITQGRIEIATTGNWRGEWHVRIAPVGDVRPDNADFETVAVLFSDDSVNPTASLDFDIPVFVSVLAISSAATNYTSLASVNFPESTLYGEAEIQTVIDAQNATALVDGALFGDGEADDWQMSEWNEVRGFPGAVGFYDNRIVFAGTNAEPLTYWSSEIGNYANMIGGTLADSPFSVSMISRDASPIQWIQTERELFIGTASEEGTSVPRDADLAAGATNLPRAVWFSNEGSMYRQPVLLNSALFALQAGAQRLNQFKYDLVADGYEPSEATLLHDHILEGGAKQIVVRRQPEKSVFITKDDGTVAGLIYEPNAELSGWFRFDTDGEILSLDIQRGDGEEDVLWMAVKRGEICCMETMPVGQRSLRRQGKQDELCYLDCASYFENVTEATGLERFDGMTVSILADGIAGTATVSGGTLTLPSEVSKLIVGLPYEFEVSPVNVEAFNEFGNTRASIKDIDEITIHYWQSLGGEVRDSSGEWRRIDDYRTAELFGVSDGPLKIGTRMAEVPVSGNHGKLKTIEIRHSEPYPFTLQGIYVGVTEGNM